MTETPINISIGNKPPVQYMAEVVAQIESGQLTLGEITSASDLERIFEENAVPANLATVTAGSYPEFLAKQRKMIAELRLAYFDQL